ncbi:MAG: tetratricopeptide repeat protein [Nitrospirae bacterium]|nr:tetratricopeptide repeat protein [Nitrospirota bacterium]
MRLNQNLLKTKLLSLILIVASVALVYTSTIWFDFCWDDISYVIQNPYIRSISWNNITAIFSRNFEGNYAPVHILAYMVEYALWGLNPKGYHLVNILLHIFNSVFLFILIRKITGRNEVALLASLIFALHPVQVENVAWVTEQKSLLAMAFFLPAFYLSVRDADNPKPSYYWASVFLYGLSLLAKVSTVSLPILLLMYELCYGKKLNTRRIINKAPYFVIAGGMSLVSIFIQTSNRGMFYFRNDPFITLFTTIVVVKNYLLSIILPVNLSAYYSLVHTRLFEPPVLLSLLLIVAVVSGTAYLFRKDRQAAFWAAWFWAAILPNLNIIPLSVVMADRYLYLPLIGPSVLFAFALFGSVKDRIQKRFPNNVHWIYAISGILILGLAVASQVRSKIWENDLTLWTDTVTRLQHGLPYTNLGAAHIERGNLAEAIKNFEKAIEVTPDYYLPYADLGRIYLQKNDLLGAEKYFVKALSLNPNNPFISQELAKIYINRGDLDLASGEISNGLKFTPNEPSLLFLKAHILTRKGELQEPLEIYRFLTRVDPSSSVNWFNFGAVLARLGRVGEAENALRQAITIDGKLLNAYKELASLYVRDGKTDQAAANFEKSLQAFQENSLALRNLSHLYLEYFPAKVDRIIPFAQKSLEKSPDDPNILDLLGWAYFKKGNYNKSVEYYKQALAALPSEPYFLYQVGIASLKAGDTRSGKSYLKELVQKYPDHVLSKQVNKRAEDN